MQEIKAKKNIILIFIKKCFITGLLFILQIKEILSKLISLEQIT